ncbi:MAG: hypothetical protein EA411_11520 [Saprospirales bacterium]|nr:MAG: hypothetical protein EA411_11520 [Saprospirales bacterium]
MKTINLKLSLLFTAFILVLTACVKEDFDEPPAEGTDPNVEVNATIADIKAFYQPGNYVQIEEDLIFSAIVVADDRSGNFFRNLVLQDETGGIQIRFNFTDLHNNYPIGRRLFIRARDLYISDFNGTLQLGGGVERDASGNITGMDGIPLPLADKFILRGKWDQDYDINTTRVDQLTEDDINTVIRLENVQFRAGDLGETFAINTIDDEGNEIRQTINHDLTSCEGDAPIIVRTSGFADFATTQLPEGSGEVVGIYTVFGDVKQLMIREIEDVMMEDERCDATITPISSIRGQFTGSPTSVAGNSVIQGVVISDKDHLNTSERNMFIQDESGGIMVRFTGNHNFPMGAMLQIDVSGQELSQFQGLLQINNVDLLAAEVLSEGNEVEPTVLTISELQANFSDYEATLVRIHDVSITKDGDIQDFAFTTTLNDGTATIDHFTRPQATFANQTIPSDEVSLTGIVSVGGTQESRQVSIRNLDDVDGDFTEPMTILFEDFQEGVEDEPLDLPGWYNIIETGTRPWEMGGFQDNQFGTASSFQSADAANKMWLITPGFEVENGVKLEFESAQGFHVHDGLTVYISNNFDGDDPTAADWTELDARIAGPQDDRWGFVSSGTIDLSAFPGNAHIAWVYEGSAPQDETTTYRLDNVRIFTD